MARLLKSIGFRQCCLVTLFLLGSGLLTRDYFTWTLEVSWVVVGLLPLAVLAARGTRLTSLLRWGLFVHAIILIYGGLYTYELTPAGEWARHLFGSDRNHYDRLGHFAQGFIPALLWREVFIRSRATSDPGWTEFFVFMCCMAFTAMFELIEFATALAFGDASTAYLGSQGDIWDAQWDMLFCGFGALTSIVLLSRAHRRQTRRLIAETP